jgi:ribosome biogenesis GTPase A
METVERIKVEVERLRGTKGITLNKTDLFDENVMNQEVEKFKQNTKRIFDYKLTEEQRIIRQKIAELQAKLI